MWALHPPLKQQLLKKDTLLNNKKDTPTNTMILFPFFIFKRWDKGTKQQMHMQKWLKMKI